MRFGLWIGPAVLTGCWIFLWVASGLERLIEPRVRDGEVGTPATVDSGISRSAARPESLG